MPSSFLGTAQGSLAVLAEQGCNGCFSSLDFWVLLGLGEPRVLPRAAPAQPFPSPHPQLRLPIYRFGQKSIFPLPGNARPVAGGLHAGKGVALRVLRRSQPGARGDSATRFWAPGPGRLVRDRACRGAGRARGSGGRDPGSAGCRERRPPPAPRSSALLQAFVFHGSVSALKGRGETPTVTGRKTELN